MKNNSDQQDSNIPNNQEISRRNVLLGILASVGAASTAGCARSLNTTIVDLEKSNAQHNSNYEFYTSKEFLLVSRLSDLIIPDTQTLGALAVGVPRLMDQLHTDWASIQTQTAHRDALKLVNDELDTISGVPFLKQNSEAQLATLSTLDNLAFSSDYQRLSAYRSIKELIARFYYLSEVGASQELRYELVPGRWEACIPFEKVGRSWAA
ncbi:gluconate 2-dehydrogenase subunit 3 family protein [Paraglaciecola arctica]|uniref:gluconate 2-dehydrogenase subunit 3 family protein n=1 Tax=Paraglaciecola arctica TaxID=1128911 RepID=UPI001C0665E0|nr:gluconate 2-dehydrogenase subunit 3 family protein [Paraglaciecola arctica]MBU3004876.1 gluconate 2-dehydrogenase subunit 3 family protein [Paraglaciecola arctica]